MESQPKRRSLDLSIVQERRQSPKIRGENTFAEPKAAIQKIGLLAFSVGR